MLAVKGCDDKVIGSVDQLGSRRCHCCRRDIPRVNVNVTGATRNAVSDIAAANYQTLQKILRRSWRRHHTAKGFNCNRLRIPQPAVWIYQIRSNLTISGSGITSNPAQTIQSDVLNAQSKCAVNLLTKVCQSRAIDIRWLISRMLDAMPNRERTMRGLSPHSRIGNSTVPTRPVSCSVAWPFAVSTRIVMSARRKVKLSA